MKNPEWIVDYAWGPNRGSTKYFAANEDEVRILFYRDLNIPSGSSIIEIRPA